MPSAFNVANSPLTANGTLAVTGAGTSAQYIRGDGQLANFPDNQGGGSSVNYYLNGSVNQGTFGGDVYYEMSKTPVLGAGTNFTRTNAQGNGYIASFITDAGDPSLLNIPGGNWNVEFYFQANSNAGNPQFYAELYKVDASNNFTLIGSGSTNPEGITNGTTIDQYYTAIPVPQTSLLVTDRLAIRIFVITSGRTITLHTENSNLCEILTTFSTGLNALNGLTAQVQYFATGTSGTDFGISSATDTHTFNLPTASSVNRGALSSADWTTFNNKVPTSRTLTINGVAFDLSADRSWTVAGGISGSGASGQVAYWTGTSAQAGSADFQWNGTNLVLGSDKGITLQTAGTNRSTRILPNNVVDNFSSLTFYPSSGTNVGQGLYLAPRGTGFSATIKTQFFLFGTDFVADQTNWEGVLFRAKSDSFMLATGKAGTGTIRPLLLSSGYADNTTNSNHLWLYPTGNVGINTTTDAGQRLQVIGDVFIKGSGATSGTTALTVQNSSSNNLLRLLNDSRLKIGNQDVDIYSSGNGSTVNANGRGLVISTSATSQTDAGALKIIGNYTSALGSDYGVAIQHTFTNGTGGTATHSGLLLNQTINQTGGANGITRGLYVNPTLTAAADFRAIETTNGKVIFGNLPTSSAGLPTGSIWNDAGTIKIV
jgi:hypothetical protein